MTQVSRPPVDDIKLPDSVIETARQLLGEEDDTRWSLGDFLSEVVAEFEPAFTSIGVRYPRAQLFRKIAGSIGCDSSTLRDRQVMAEFFTPVDRKRYDALSYHQLRACKSAGDEWEKYADWALANLPAPVAVIRTKIKNNGDLPPAWLGRWERVVTACSSLMDDESAPPGVRLAARLIYLKVFDG